MLYIFEDKIALITAIFICFNSEVPNWMNDSRKLTPIFQIQFKFAIESNRFRLFFVSLFCSRKRRQNYKRSGCLKRTCFVRLLFAGNCLEQNSHRISFSPMCVSLIWRLKLSIRWWTSRHMWHWNIRFLHLISCFWSSCSSENPRPHIEQCISKSLACNFTCWFRCATLVKRLSQLWHANGLQINWNIGQKLIKFLSIIYLE